MSDAIRVIEKTMISVSDGKCILPLRNVIDVGSSNRLGIMPGVLSEGGLYGVKVLSLFPENPSKGLSSHIGVVILFDPETGTPSAAINADALTAVRTAAATAVATKVLSRVESSKLTIIGTGEQAEAHIEAILLVRDITKINIVGREMTRAKDFLNKVEGRFPNIKFTAFQNVKDGIKGSDIVCTVDYRPSALAQAKEIIDGVNSKAFDRSHILGEIGEVLSGKVKGRLFPSDITLYRSMGIAAQDLACADFVFQKAKKEGYGIFSDIT
jgi:ornithine cyclodeaminase/alanine dehydrogenase-like protein (mu-crystallin family)